MAAGLQNAMCTMHFGAVVPCWNDEERIGNDEGHDFFNEDLSPSKEIFLVFISWFNLCDFMFMSLDFTHDNDDLWLNLVN